MKYLVINGSPHKGNTWKLAELAMEEIRRTDRESRFDEMHLMEAKLPFCTGCSLCFRKGGEHCPHYEIMQDAIMRMHEADGIIVITATFIARETALLKNFFDHMAYMMHRPAFFTKKALVITTTGGVGGKGAAKSVAETLCGIGMNKCCLLYAASYSWNAYEPKERTRKQVIKTTRAFCMDVMSGKMHFPSTGVLIPYNLFRGMAANYAPGMKYEMADGIYYGEKEHADRVYAQGIPLLPYQRLVGMIFYIIAKYVGKYIVVTYKK